MASLREIVEQEIADDPFLQEAVNRSIVNGMGLARWLKEHRGIEGETEAIANEIRKVQKKADESKIVEARSILEEANVLTVSGLTLLRIRRDDRIEQKLSSLIAEFNLAEDRLSLSTDKSLIHLLVDDENADEAIDALDSVLVDDPQGDLAEIILRTESAERGAEVLGVALQALSAKGVEAVRVDQGEKFQSILVGGRDEDFSHDKDAWRIFSSLEPS